MSDSHEKVKIFLNSSPSTEPFAIESIGITYADANYHHCRSKSLKVTVFEYVISGSGIVKTSSGNFEPKAGDSYLLCADDDQEYYSNLNDPWTKIWVNIIGVLPTEILNAYGLMRSTLFKQLNISEFIERIHQVGEQNENDLAYINDRCFITFIKLCQFLRRYTLSTDGIKIPENITALKNYIDAHLNEKISLEKCGQIAGLSVSQTIRKFSKFFGMPPYEYMNQQRIETAKILLTSSQLPIYDIANQIGFADQYYFSKYFKKKIGKSPENYRAFK